MAAIKWARKKSSKKKSTKKRDDPEHQLQCAFIEWLTLAHPDVRRVTWAVPNGVFCSITQARKLKKEGMTNGVPDISIMYPNSIYPALFIEMKIHPRKPSPEQQAMIIELRAKGFMAEVCYTIDEAMELINTYVKS